MAISGAKATLPSSLTIAILDVQALRFESHERPSSARESRFLGQWARTGRSCPVGCPCALDFRSIGANVASTRPKQRPEADRCHGWYVPPPGDSRRERGAPMRARCAFLPPSQGTIPRSRVVLFMRVKMPPDPQQIHRGVHLIVCATLESPKALKHQ